MRVESFYICEVCGKKYITAAQAIQCEAIPITNDKGVAVNDIVLITKGGLFEGQRLKVKELQVIQPGYLFPRYDHSRAIIVDIGSEQRPSDIILLYDQYEVV